MNKDLGIKNVHASADVSNDSIKFLYKIKEGATGQSYGINVAKLAKLPDEVIARAKVILDSLQDNNMETKLEASSNTVIVEKESAAEKMLSQIDPMQLSPIDALSTLIELKKLL
jgi:DNA mismatch repair protein MutS